jgi:UDP-2,3-diacylglucosamine pyrophosphatase LpxH
VSASAQPPTLSQPLLFISDVHIGGFSDQENERIESELIQLVNYCQQNKIQIAILGDLFDYWMEYPDTVPSIGEQLLNRFEEFNQELGPTLFITGNHDNWTRDHLSQRGFYLEDEQHSFTIDSNRLMALHGDGLANPDLKLPRPFLHRLLRNEKFLTIFQSVFPADVGLKIMKYFSRLTRRIDEENQRVKRLNGWARQQLKQTDTDIILCGHDHIPRQKQFPFGTYINLGTFYYHRTMALYNNDMISLVCWKADTQTIKQLRNPQQ